MQLQLCFPLAPDGCDRSASCFLPLQTRGSSCRYLQNRRLGEPQRRLGPPSEDTYLTTVRNRTMIPWTHSQLPTQFITHISKQNYLTLQIILNVEYLRQPKITRTPVCAVLDWVIQQTPINRGAMNVVIVYKP
jgi:hypothetical protein